MGRWNEFAPKIVRDGTFCGALFCPRTSGQPARGSGRVGGIPNSEVRSGWAGGPNSRIAVQPFSRSAVQPYGLYPIATNIPVATEK